MELGNWKSVFKRFRASVKAGVFQRLFDAISDEPDMEYAMGRCHDRSRPPPRPRCKRGTERQAISKSKGGWPTKIVALVDALGNLVRFELLPGHRYDTLGVPPLIEGVAFDALIADKTFDSNWLLEELDERGAKVVISTAPQAHRPAPNRSSRCTLGAISSRTSSALTRSSSGLPPAPTKPPIPTRPDLRRCNGHPIPRLGGGLIPA